jgi:hypothetical protein
LDRVRSVWPALLELLHQRKAAVAGFLSSGVPVRIEAGQPPQLCVGFPKGNRFHCDNLNRPNHRQIVEQALAELLGGPLRCRFQEMEELSPGGSGEFPLTLDETSAPSPATGPRPAAAVDPTFLKSVLELFEGRLLPEEG